MKTIYDADICWHDILAFCINEDRPHGGHHDLKCEQPHVIMSKTVTGPVVWCMLALTISVFKLVLILK